MGNCKGVPHPTPYSVCSGAAGLTKRVPQRKPIRQLLCSSIHHLQHPPNWGETHGRPGERSSLAGPPHACNLDLKALEREQRTENGARWGEKLPLPPPTPHPQQNTLPTPSHSYGPYLRRLKVLTITSTQSSNQGQYPPSPSCEPEESPHLEQVRPSWDKPLGLRTAQKKHLNEKTPVRRGTPGEDLILHFADT